MDAVHQWCSTQHNKEQNKRSRCTNLIQDKYITRISLDKFFVHQVQDATWCGNDQVHYNKQVLFLQCVNEAEPVYTTVTIMHS